MAAWTRINAQQRHKVPPKRRAVVSDSDAASTSDDESFPSDAFDHFNRDNVPMHFPHRNWDPHIDGYEDDACIAPDEVAAEPLIVD